MTDVPVERCGSRAEKKEKEAQNENGVHASRPRFADALLQHHFTNESFVAARILFERFSRTRFPAANVFPNAVAAEENGKNTDDVDADFAPERTFQKAGRMGMSTGRGVLMFSGCLYWSGQRKMRGF